MEHIKIFYTRVNIPKLIRVCDEQQHWKELTYLYIQYDEFDNAATTIMNYSPDAWDHMQFKNVAFKRLRMSNFTTRRCISTSRRSTLISSMTCYTCFHFVWIIPVLFISCARRTNHRSKPYMVAVQSYNVAAVNEALNEIYVDSDRLRESVDMHEFFKWVTEALET